MTARPVFTRRAVNSRRLSPMADRLLSLVCVTLTVGMIVSILWSATA